MIQLFYFLCCLYKYVSMYVCLYSSVINCSTVDPFKMNSSYSQYLNYEKLILNKLQKEILENYFYVVMQCHAWQCGLYMRTKPNFRIDLLLIRTWIVLHHPGGVRSVGPGIISKYNSHFRPRAYTRFGLRWGRRVVKMSS